jgi:hypothetical protein
LADIENAIPDVRDPRSPYYGQSVKKPKSYSRPNPRTSPARKKVKTENQVFTESMKDCVQNDGYTRSVVSNGVAMVANGLAPTATGLGNIARIPGVETLVRSVVGDTAADAVSVASQATETLGRSGIFLGDAVSKGITVLSCTGASADIAQKAVADGEAAIDESTFIGSDGEKVDTLIAIAATDSNGPSRDEEKRAVTDRSRRTSSNPTYSKIQARVVSAPSYDDVLDAIGASVQVGLESAASEDIASGMTPKRNLRSSLQIIPSSGGETVFITDFFLTDIREEDAEKFQIVETFGSNYIFFFGRKPLIYVANGILYNSENYQWKNNFKDKYNRFLRGTQLVKARSRVIFMYEDVVREGYILNFSHQIQAQNPHAVPFSFSMFVTREFDARPGGRG